MSPSRAPASTSQEEPKFLDFYFDFVSPYGYLALNQIEALASRHDRTLRWHPFHMRAVMKDVLGMTRALADVPLKGSYVRNDVLRMARYLDVAYKPAPAAGFSSVAAGRVFYLIHERDSAAAARYARAVFHSHHTLASSPNSWEHCAALARQVGVDPALLVEAEQAQRGRDLFRLATDTAVAQGVWGTPTFVVDGEIFWGCDRIAQLDDWLRRGGW
ncbi:MAG: 2-hydroxychromene-2-carboxylate isomerase [Rhodoferax sp.]